MVSVLREKGFTEDWQLFISCFQYQTTQTEAIFISLLFAENASIRADLWWEADRSMSYSRHLYTKLKQDIKYDSANWNVDHYFEVREYECCECLWHEDILEIFNKTTNKFRFKEECINRKTTSAHYSSQQRCMGLQDQWNTIYYMHTIHPPS